MSTTRVWNITSDPSTDVPPQNLVVFGRLLRPGQFVQVDEKQLEDAHKLMASVAGKLLVVSKATPGYLAKAEKAKLAADTASGHSTPAPAKVEEPKKDEPKKDETRFSKRKG